MKNLMRNELLKWRRSWSVTAVFLLYVFFYGSAALAKGGNTDSLLNYGFGAPFMAFGMIGMVSLGLYAVMAAGMAADEFKQGTVHNALACGVKRRNYFFAKTNVMLGGAALLYLCSLAVFCAVRISVLGIGPDTLIYSNYWLAVLVYNMGVIVVIMSNMALYIFIAYLTKSGVKTFIISFLLSDLELIVYSRCMKMNVQSEVFTCGPVGTMEKMMKLVYSMKDSKALLSADFALMLLPCVCIGGISLIMGYQVFKRSDIK